MRDLISKILKESDFDWTSDITPMISPSMVGQKFRIWWDNSEWLGHYENYDINSGDVFTLNDCILEYDEDEYEWGTPFVGTIFHFKHEQLEDDGINTLSIPIDPNFWEDTGDEEDDIYWRPQNFGIRYEPILNENFDWVGGVNPLKHGDYYIDARDLSREERIELQKKLLNLGFRWDSSSSDGPDQVNLWALNTLQGYTIDGSKNRIYYSIEPYDGVSRRWLKYLSYDEFLELINENINEDFDWVEEVPSLPLNKEDHWFIFVNSLEEQREAEDYIHSRGYTIYGPEYEDYCFYKDPNPNPLSSLEHDPEEGRTLDNLYDGRYLSYEKAKEEYPDAKIYVWSKVKGINEDFNWTSDIEPKDEFRFFEIALCTDWDYDDDECYDAESYYFKVPSVYIGIENSGYDEDKILEWAMEKEIISKNLLSIYNLNYVDEVDVEVYCRYEGKYNDDDKQLCQRF